MAEEVEEVKEEEKIEEEEKKEKKEVEKKKKKRKGLFSHYKVEGDSFKRLLPFCERCGIGYFMADHGDRYTCGHCGFTRYKPTEAEE
jgi:small subunit ribosomal protein S27Ae